MTVKTVAAIASLGAALASTAGCLSFYEIPIEIPMQAKIDVSAFDRILVAGFLSGGTSNIDSNSETARLLRSQLRNRQEMRVIDAEVLSLVDEVRRRRGTTEGAKPADAAQIVSEQDLGTYETIFSDTEFWKALGEGHERPLIVTGSVLFTEVARSGISAKPESYIDAQGLEQFRTVPTYIDQKGYSLSPKFIFIDGRTGAQLYSETYHEESYYPSGQNTPALSSYFELMDRLLPGFLSTLSTQKIRGSRILLK